MSEELPPPSSSTSSSPSSSPSSCTSSSSSPPPRPHYILFDLGGVVFSSPIHSIIAYEQSLGLPPFAINRVMARSSNWQEFEKGSMGTREFVERFQREWDEVAQRFLNQQQQQASSCPSPSSSPSSPLPPVSISHLLSLLHSVLSSPRPHYVHAIQRLQDAGLVVGCITNNSKKRVGDEEGADMDKVRVIFNREGREEAVIVQSCVVGMRKPDEDIFRLTLEELGKQQQRKQSGSTAPSSSSSSSSVLPVAASECVFLDDIGANVKAARRIGMQTIKVGRDEFEALEELERVTGVTLEWEKFEHLRKKTRTKQGRGEEAPRAKL